MFHGFCIKFTTELFTSLCHSCRRSSKRGLHRSPLLPLNRSRGDNKDNRLDNVLAQSYGHATKVVPPRKSRRLEEKPGLAGRKLCSEAMRS